MLLLKFSGLLLIFSTSSLMGAFKALGLKKRSDKLHSLCVSLSKLAQLVRNGAGELKKLFELSFEKEMLAFENGKPVLVCSYFEKDDIRLAENFLQEIGMSDSESEYKHILIYQTLFEEKARQAAQKAETLSKLYRSLGVLAGLSICIFLV